MPAVHRPPSLVVALGLCALLLAPPLALADAISKGNFVLTCKYSHTLPDDPIVFPDQPGASHLHDFFGNITTSAASTQESMLAGTANCKDVNDTAGYWAPTAYLNGIQITPREMRIYYIARPNVTVETIPPGLQMIGGNHDAISPAGNPNVHWFCGATSAVKTPIMDHPYDCTPYAGNSFVDGVVSIVEMPNCWNGLGLRPEDVAYEVNRSCPSGFPHILPSLSQRVHFGVMNPLNPDGTVALSLSSGPYYTLHSDFWNTWQQPRLDTLVVECLIAHVHCGDVRTPREIAWIRQFGTTRYDSGLDTAVGATGVYVAGFTKFALDGQTHLGQSDGFVRKFDPEGSELWTRQFGTSGNDEAVAIAVDPTGVYVAGFTDGTFRGRASYGGFDAFLRKYDRNGDAIWTHQFGTPGADQAVGIALDDSGVYVAGSTDGTFPGQTAAGIVDGFLLKLGRGGTELWTRQFGTAGTDPPLGIALDHSGVYVAGSTDGTFFGQTAAGIVDGFLLKLGRGGRELWTRQFGTSGTDRPLGIGVNALGVYLAGSTDGIFSGQRGAGTVDGFLLRYDSDGNAGWTRQFGTPELDEATGVVATATRLVVVGSTRGAFPTYDNQGGWDLFVRRHHLGGKDEWTHGFGTSENEQAFTIAVDSTGMYVAGWIHGAFPGQTFQGDRDVFVVKIL